MSCNVYFLQNARDLFSPKYTSHFHDLSECGETSTFVGSCPNHTPTWPRNISLCFFYTTDSKCTNSFLDSFKTMTAIVHLPGDTDIGDTHTAAFSRDVQKMLALPVMLMSWNISCNPLIVLCNSLLLEKMCSNDLWIKERKKMVKQSTNTQKINSMHSP